MTEEHAHNAESGPRRDDAQPLSEFIERTPLDLAWVRETQAQGPAPSRLVIRQPTPFRLL